MTAPELIEIKVNMHEVPSFQMILSCALMKLFHMATNDQADIVFIYTNNDDSAMSNSNDPSFIFAEYGERILRSICPGITKEDIDRYRIILESKFFPAMLEKTGDLAVHVHHGLIVERDVRTIRFMLQALHFSDEAFYNMGFALNKTDRFEATIDFMLEFLAGSILAGYKRYKLVREIITHDDIVYKVKDGYENMVGLVKTHNGKIRYLINTNQDVSAIQIISPAACLRLKGLMELVEGTVKPNVFEVHHDTESNTLIISIDAVHAHVVISYFETIVPL